MSQPQKNERYNDDGDSANLSGGESNDDWQILSHRHNVGNPVIEDGFEEKSKITAKPVNRQSYFDKSKKNFANNNSFHGKMMGRTSMPDANFVHRSQSIKVNYPADRPQQVGASVNLGQSGNIDVKKSQKSMSRAQRYEMANQHVDVEENTTDRISLNQKDEENNELTISGMKNFHSQNKDEGSAGVRKSNTVLMSSDVKHSIEQPIIHLSDIMQETNSDLAINDQSAVESMQFEVQLPTKQVQQAKFQAVTQAAPLAAASRAGTKTGTRAGAVTKKNIIQEKKQKEKSIIESARMSKETQQTNFQNVNSPIKSTPQNSKKKIIFQEKKIKSQEKETSAVDLAYDKLMSDIPLNSSENEQAPMKEKPIYKFQRLDESQTYWCIKDHLNQHRKQHTTYKFFTLVAVFCIGGLIKMNWVGKYKDPYVVDGVNNYKWALLLYFGYQMTENNMGQRLEPSIKNNMLMFILILARIFIVFFACYWLGPNIYQVFNWSFINMDVWSSTSPIYKQNYDNVYNTTITWIVVMNLCVILPLMLVAFCLCLKRSIRDRKKKKCCGFVGFLFGTSRNNIIHNTIMDKKQHQEEGEHQEEGGAEDNNSQVLPDNQEVLLAHTEPDNQEELQAFLDKTKINMHNALNFAVSRDCPLCFKQFRDINQVIQLKCNSMHLYHEQCLIEMEEFRSVEKNCLICDAKIEY